MKRYLALFLSLVMILCALPLAIAEDVENPYEDDGIVIYRDADGNVIDLGGMEITVCDWWSSDWHDDEPTTAAGEATYDYRTWLEETYNFKIVQRNATTWNDSPSDFTNFATTAATRTMFGFSAPARTSRPSRRVCSMTCPRWTA